VDAMSMGVRQFALHGLAIELACDVPTLSARVEHLLGSFAVTGFPEGFSLSSGVVSRYQQTDVLRHLSPTATRVTTPGNLLELYEEDERFWLVDDRWGLAEINLLKSQWRSWVLPWPTVDAVEVEEMAILWPLAQILRSKGLYLMPAVSVVRDGWGVLLISPFGLEEELAALVGTGYKIVGQRWTAIREEEGRMAMLHVPGEVRRNSQQTPACGHPVGSRQWADDSIALPGMLASANAEAGWVDLMGEYLGAQRNHAFCDVVVRVERGRRPRSSLNQVDPQVAATALRQSWPMVELHPQRRQGQLAAKLARYCDAWSVQLSERPREILTMLDAIRRSTSRRLRRVVAAVA